jgi:hypothetical protein
MKDMRSVKGNNLRRIILLTNKRKLGEVPDADIDKVVYAEMPSDNGWRVPITKEITDMNFVQIIDTFSLKNVKKSWLDKV